MERKINKDKIILMTRLAVYDKNQGEADKRVNNYYLHDYIARSNFSTHIAVISGCLILAFFYALDLIFNKGADLMTIDYSALLRRLGLYTLIVLAVYTVIGSIYAARRYHETKKRIDEYTRDLALLDDENYGKKDKNKEKGARRARTGDTRYNTRPHNAAGQTRDTRYDTRPYTASPRIPRDTPPPRRNRPTRKDI